MAFPLARSWKSLMYFVNYFHNDFTYKEYNLVVSFHNEWELNESHILPHSTEIWTGITALSWNIHYKRSSDILKFSFSFLLLQSVFLFKLDLKDYLTIMQNDFCLVLTGYSANGKFLYLCNGYEFSQATNSGVRNGTSLFSFFNGT